MPDLLPLPFPQIEINLHERSRLQILHTVVEADQGTPSTEVKVEGNRRSRLSYKHLRVSYLLPSLALVKRHPVHHLLVLRV